MLPHPVNSGADRELPRESQWKTLAPLPSKIQLAKSLWLCSTGGEIKQQGAASIHISSLFFCGQHRLKYPKPHEHLLSAAQG